MKIQRATAFVKRFFAPRGRSGAIITPQSPSWLKTSFRDLTLQGYCGNELVYSCIQMVANSTAEAPAKVASLDDKEFAAVGGFAVLAQPNMFWGAKELWVRTVEHLSLAGNAFWWKKRDARGEMIELWPLMPDRVKIIPHRRKFILGYAFQEPDGTFTPIRFRDMVHFRSSHPLDDYFGMPALAVAARQVAMDNEETSYAKTVLENTGVPSVVVLTERELDGLEAEVQRAKWNQNFAGSRRGNISFFQKGMDFKVLSLDFNQLAFSSLRDVSETRICGVLGVPPILVGANVGLKQSSYRNYGTAKLSFWEETIAPLQGLLAEVLSVDEDFAPPGFRVVFDNRFVSALREARHRQMEDATKSYVAGVLRRNEARIMMGFPPDPDPDIGEVYAHPLASAIIRADGEILVPASQDETDEGGGDNV